MLNRSVVHGCEVRPETSSGGTSLGATLLALLDGRAVAQPKQVLPFRLIAAEPDDGRPTEVPQSVATGVLAE